MRIEIICLKKSQCNSIRKTCSYEKNVEGRAIFGGKKCTIKKKRVAV